MGRLALSGLGASGLGAGLALALAAPAQAAEGTAGAWEAAARAFVEGEAVAVPAETAQELTLCAAYWGEWNGAQLDRQFSAEELAPLPAGAKIPDSQMKAVLFLLMLDETDEAEAELQRVEAEARELIAGTKAGNRATASAFFGKLGGCVL